MKKAAIPILIIIASTILSCGKANFLGQGSLIKSIVSSFGNRSLGPMSFSYGSNDQAGSDALSSSTNQSDKDEIKAPKLNAYEGAAFVKPPQINNYGTVTLSYQVDVPPGRAGMQPGVGLSYSSSGGDGLAGIGWSLSTGLGVISRTTKNGQLYYDWRDTFTFNGQRLVKVEGAAGSENGVYRQEIESGFSKFVLTDSAGGGVWRVYDKAGTVTVFGETRASRIFRPDDDTRTYIWNFSKSTDLNGNFMTAEYDDSSYAENHVLYLKEIRYTGNEREGTPARQFVRFSYKERDEAYVSKAPGFIMRMDRLLDRITVGWDDPSGITETELWSYGMVYDISEDSGRPLLKTVDTERETTKPEFLYQQAIHGLTWAQIENPDAGDPEENPDNTKYFEGDFNGDGISDMVFFNPKTGDWRALEGKRDGGYLSKLYGNRFQGYEGADRIQWFKGNVTGDYNGDGRSDIAFYLPQTKEFWVAEHNGKTFDFRSYGRLIIDIDIFKCEWFTGDFDGNGLSDTVLYNEPTGAWYLMANKGGRFEFIKFSSHFRNLFRSDYKPDLNLDSPSTADMSENGRDREKIYFLSGDYNGDGRTDISFYDARSGKWWVAENYRDDVLGFKLQWRLYKQFTETEKQLFAPGKDSLAGNDRFCGDFNGDGLSDFLIFHRDRGEWILGETVDGTINFRVFSRTSAFKDITRWLQGDFNGDGRTDIGFYSSSDDNFWIGEATPDGFRFRVYANMEGGPDPSRVLAKAPLPRDEVQLKDARAVVAGSLSTALIQYQYDGNYHTERGEQAFPGFYTGTGATPELLIYNRGEKRLYLKNEQGDPVYKIGADLDGEGVTLIDAARPGRYRSRDGLLYYKKTSFFGSETHSFNVIDAETQSFADTMVAQFSGSTVTDFDIAKSVYVVDRFLPTSTNTNKRVLILDDKAQTPAFVLFTESSGSITPTRVTVGTGDLNAAYFKDLRDRRARYRFFTGPFTATGAQVLLADATGGSCAWYLGSLTGSTSSAQIRFTRLSGNPSLYAEGFVESYRVSAGTPAILIYGAVNDGQASFHRVEVTSASIRETNYPDLAQGIEFRGDFDHENNPIVWDGTTAKKAVLGSYCRLEDLAAASVTLKRQDLVEKTYPFQWIQGDYNGDGKTDIGFFHMKEARWYFALTKGTVPDLISEVRNGIGGRYKMTYENSTRFDNTDEEGIPRLPMNYKVCTSLVMEDGIGGMVRTEYEYSGGYAFSAFINGEKETDYFGFGRFSVIDAAGRHTDSEYYNVPYEDFRMNRALAGAVKVSRTIGSDTREYERTEHAYTVRIIDPGVTAPGGQPARSYLVEPTEVKTYKKDASQKDVLTSTRASTIELTAGKYEMTGKSESAIDHYSDAAHQSATVTAYTRFTNIDDTNEMRVEYKKNLAGTAYETMTSYEYDGRGNVTRETTRYSESGLPAVSDKVMEYTYDGYGNRVSATNASGSPARVTEKTFDAKLHQFVTQERALGDVVTLTTTHDINYESAFGGLNRTTDPNGNSTYFEYDGTGRLTRERIDADTGVETLQTYAYDTTFPLSAKATQYPSTSTGSDKIETRVFGDGMGRVIHTVRSATAAAGKRYVKSGLLVYDPAGRLIRKSQTGWAADGEIDAYKPNLKEKNPTVTQYDPAGRVSRVTLPEGFKGEAETSITYTYNDPWETVETHSVGRSKRTVRNARGQVLYVEDSGRGDDGQSVDAKIGFAYDIAGNRVKKMDLNVVAMTIDVPSNLFSPGVKDESGNNVACWRYNAFGQVTESSDPDLGYARVEYNAFGEAALREDALGRITTFSYDSLGRLAEKNLPGGEGAVHYGYDALAGSDNALGRMTFIDDPAQCKEFSYDAIGRVKTERRRMKGVAGEPVFETGFRYDLLSRKKSIAYPVDPKSGVRMTVEYGYCAMGPAAVHIDNGYTARDLVSGISYNEFGQMTEVRRGNGTITTYNYDIKGRMESLLTTASHNGQTWKVQDVKYEFKTDNSIAAVENTPDVAADGACQSRVRYEYQYDGLNRLVHARGSYEKTLTAPGTTDPLNPLAGPVVKKYDLGYGYADNGNMTGKSVYDPDTGSETDRWTYAYANHAATAVTTTAGGARFAMQYDAAGNMISQADASKNAAKQMAYDSYNRIRQVTDQNTGTVKGTYWYDDQGFRVRREARMEVDGAERNVELLYPSMYFSVETQKDQDGVPVGDTGYGVNNIYLNGVRMAAVLPNGDAQYYLTDQVDSVKVVTNDSGLVVTSHEYMPFGEDWITEGDTKNSPKYNSQELDKESGYYFYNARHYDPEIGRFVTPDTVIDGELSTQGWNRFAYVHNNPIVYRDPTGHKSIIIDMPGGENDMPSDKYLKDLAGSSQDVKGDYSKGQLKLFDRNGVKQLKENPDVLITSIKNNSPKELARLNGILKNLPKDVTEVVFAGSHGSRRGAWSGPHEEDSSKEIKASDIKVDLGNRKVFFTGCHQGRSDIKKEWSRSLFGGKNKSDQIEGNPFWSEYTSKYLPPIFDRDTRLLKKIVKGDNIRNLFQDHKNSNIKDSINDSDFSGLLKDIEKLPSRPMGKQGSDAWLQKELHRQGYQ